MRNLIELHSPEEYERGEGNTGGGFNGLCDNCSFHVSCRPDYDEVKRLCDDHNNKNPGHDAAPINC